VPEQFRPGASGVFKALVDGAKKFKRAVTGGGDDELSPEVLKLGEQIAQAFVAGRFADVHSLGTPGFQVRSPRESFVTRWHDATRERGPLTGFDISDAGQIDLGFIPGLEEVPQSSFVAFLEIAFSTPTTPLDADNAFAVAAIVLDDAGSLRLGALHAR
jgi:hypothetical protein